ncbi:MAG: hypothetical protein SGI89_06930 [bacterium]|nr:hypothetical protein [bacterium]
MELVSKVKNKLLKNSYVNELNKRNKLRRFYSRGIKPNDKAETILFWSTGGMVVQSNLEGAIATSLKLRGHNVRMILCDGIYKACAKRVDFPDVPIEDWGKYCRSCISQNSGLFKKLGLEYTFISDLVSEEKLMELKSEADKITFENYKDISLNGLRLGSHLEATMMRHTRGALYTGLEEHLKEYALTVLVNAEASAEAVKKFNPTRIYMSHGIYADWGPALHVAIQKNIQTTSYICCYLTAHFFFGSVKNFDETFLTVNEKSWSKSKSIAQTPVQKKRLENFLQRRYFSNESHDLKGLLKEYKGDKGINYEKYGLDPSKPVWGIMTHINWDATSDYFPMIHKSFDEWLYETVKEIYNVKDVQWLIKIHPSEKNDNPETGCQEFIAKNFPDLPSHVKVVKMDDEISSLDFYDLLDGAVTVMGTGGLELSMKGKPVILAGEAHYSNKGFTFDAKDNDDYKRLLRDTKNLQGLDEEKKSLAWKYGYIYFIQKQIPLTPTIMENLYIDFDKIDHLLPGKNKFMDFLCDRIIDGENFILPEELVSLTHITDLDQIRNDS